MGDGGDQPVSPRAFLVALIVLSVVLGGMVTPLGTSPAVANPVKPTQFHVETFSDGMEEATGYATNTGHEVFEFQVPAGSRVLSASVNLSRVRFLQTTTELADIPGSIWCGELDRESVQDDVIVAYPEADRVDVLTWNDDSKQFVVRASLDVPNPTSVTADDLDRDNDEDVLVTSGSEGRLYIFEEIASDTYAEPTFVPVGPRPTGVATSDLDPDFRRDVVVANSGGASVTVLHGRGDLAFYPRLDEMGNGPSAVQLRDIDKDLDMDLIVTESRNDTVSIWYNEGNGNFSNVSSLPTGVGPIALDVADLNRDSLVDIAVACSGDQKVWVYSQEEDGSFVLDELLAVGKAPRAVVGIHANEPEDTNLDVVTACSGSDNLTIYLAGGDLRHTQSVDVPVAGRPVGLGDLKGDRFGYDRIVVSCQMPPSLVLLEPGTTAEGFRLGFGNGGSENTTELPIGTEHAVIDMTEAVSSYVTTHHDEARHGFLWVRMEVWAIQAGWFRLSDLDVWAQANRPPRADAGRNVTVLVGKPAELNASSSYDADGDALEYLWFVPGNTDPAHSDEVSRHVWTEPGVYPVFLVVKDPWDLQDQDQVFVTVNAPPVARGVVPDTVTALEEVRLSAHLSEDPDGSIEDYMWDLGQGVVHGRSVDVVFTGSGSVNVTLVVTDDRDARTVATYVVEILPAEEPLREPAERPPTDRGEVPGMGAATSLTALLAVLVASATRRRRR
jgi:hypothetical protein